MQLHHQNERMVQKKQEVHHLLLQHPYQKNFPVSTYDHLPFLKKTQQLK
uniref:Bm1450 n=1 Tax=Brugia malayi TaxID=6279 RepID=A0A1I9G1H6_BRUMA|nr:Bm1450 [Brugia malayi]